MRLAGLGAHDPAAERHGRLPHSHGCVRYPGRPARAPPPRRRDFRPGGRPAHGRAEWSRLGEHCAGDPGLRSEVETLLRHDREARAELEGLVGDGRGGGRRVDGWRRRRLAWRPWRDRAAREGLQLGQLAAGARAGPRRHGLRSGWASGPDGDFEQEVAIKLIRPGLESSQRGPAFRRRAADPRRPGASLDRPALRRRRRGPAGGPTW